MDAIRFVLSLPGVIVISILSLIALVVTAGEANPHDLIAVGIHDYVIALHHAIIPSLFIYWIVAFLFKSLTGNE